MKVRMLCLSVCVILASAVLALAADVNGKWTAEVPGRGGQTSVTTFTFKVEGEKLTGTVNSRGTDTAISDGKVAGDKISFNIVREIQGNSIKLVYNGTVAGDEIKFSRTIEGGPGGAGAQEFTAKRSK